MIHGIYIKLNPKGKWNLLTVAASPEAAANEVALQQAKLKDKGAQVAAYCFETSFYIPESLDELKPQKPMFN